MHTERHGKTYRKTYRQAWTDIHRQTRMYTEKHATCGQPIHMSASCVYNYMHGGRSRHCRYNNSLIYNKHLNNCIWVIRQQYNIVNKYNNSTEADNNNNNKYPTNSKSMRGVIILYVYAVGRKYAQQCIQRIQR